MSCINCNNCTQCRLDGAEFFVNEEKGVVVCKVFDCEDLLIADVASKGYPPHEDLIIENSYIGIARCSKDDVFDVEIGKQIAERRAFAAITNAKKNALKAFVKSIMKSSENIKSDSDKLIGKYMNAVEHDKSYIKKLTGDNTAEPNSGDKI